MKTFVTTEALMFIIYKGKCTKFADYGTTFTYKISIINAKI